MDLATRERATEFAELMCADPQWVREEFDALIAASFRRPPVPPPPAPPWLPPGRGPRYPLSRWRAGHLPESRIVWHAEPRRNRQRSPPA